MKKYINFNTEKITNYANSFEKYSFELIINSVYGETMENFRKKNQCQTSKNEKCFLKKASRPTHIADKIFAKNYAAAHEIKPVITLNKPIYL